jgi:hypothetical protein
MTRRLKFALVATATVACVLGTTMQSQALNCQRGSFTTSRCFQALDKQIRQAQGIKDCLRAMEDEYSGRNSGAGAGARFEAKKKQCLKLIADLNSGAGLDEAGGEQAEVDSAVQAIDGWANK